MVGQDILKDVYYVLNKIDNMTMHELKLFDEKQIRTVWDEVQESGISASMML